MKTIPFIAALLLFGCPLNFGQTLIPVDKGNTSQKKVDVTFQFKEQEALKLFKEDSLKFQELKSCFQQACDSVEKESFIEKGSVFRNLKKYIKAGGPAKALAEAYWKELWKAKVKQDSFYRYYYRKVDEAVQKEGTSQKIKELTAAYEKQSENNRKNLDSALYIYFLAQRSINTYFPLFDRSFKLSSDTFEINGTYARSRLMEYYFTSTSSDQIIKLFESSQLGFSIEETAVGSQVELLTDYLPIGKVSFTSVISTSGNTDSSMTEGEAVEAITFENLVNGGGNLNLNLAIPLGFHQGNAKMVQMGCLLNTRVGVNIPKINSISEQAAFQGEISSLLFSNLNALNNEISMFIGVKPSFFIFEEADKSEFRNFFWLQGIAGLTFSNKYRLAITFSTNREMDIPQSFLSFTYIP